MWTPCSASSSEGGSRTSPRTTCVDVPDEGPQLVRVPGQTPQGDRLAFEQRDQPPADVPGSAGQQHHGDIRHKALRLCLRHHVQPDFWLGSVSISFIWKFSLDETPSARGTGQKNHPSIG